MNPGKIVRPSKQDDRALFRYKPGYRTIPVATALDWSDRESGRLRQGGGDVQQQRPLPQVRRRHHVPVVPRHARGAAPHARARQHAAPRALRPARRFRRSGARFRGSARGARPVRLVQGLQARVPDRRGHGEDEGRVPLPLPAAPRDDAEGPPRRLPAALRASGLAVLVPREPAAGHVQGPRSASRRSARCRRGGAMRSGEGEHGRRGATGRTARSCCSSTPSTATSSPRTRAPRSRCSRRRATKCILPRAADGGRPLCCGRTFLAGGLVDEARAEARRMLEALGPASSTACPIIGLEPSCLLGLRDEFLSMLPGADAAEARGAMRACSRSSSRARLPRAA